MLIYPHTFIHPQGVQTPHMSPILLSASVCSERHLHVVGGYRGPLCWTHPLHAGHLPPDGGCLPICLTPTHWLDSLCICMFKGISACDMGNTPLMLGVWGHSPYIGGLGASASLLSFGVWQYIHWVSVLLYLVPFF